MKKITPEDLKKLSAIMAKENPEAYAKGYEDAERSAASEIDRLNRIIEYLEYQKTHFINYIHAIV